MALLVIYAEYLATIGVILSTQLTTNMLQQMNKTHLGSDMGPRLSDSTLLSKAMSSISLLKRWTVLLFCVGDR